MTSCIFELLEYSKTVMFRQSRNKGGTNRALAPGAEHVGAQNELIKRIRILSFLGPGGTQLSSLPQAQKTLVTALCSGYT
jgi:hypothetical protein